MRNSIYLQLSVISLIVLIIIQSCNTEDESKIMEKYYIEKIGDSKTSLSYELNENGNSYRKDLISAYIYEVLWNKNFILVKQHPEYDVQVEARLQIRKHIIRNILKEKEFINENAFYQDTLLVEKVDSIAKIEFEKRIESGDLKSIKNVRENKNAEENNITFYYLIDIKNNPEEPIVFFSKDSLNFYIDKLEVGKFKNKRKF